MNLFITSLENVNKSRTSANVSLTLTLQMTAVAVCRLKAIVLTGEVN
jgi:hypothetical protein